MVKIVSSQMHDGTIALVTVKALLKARASFRSDWRALSKSVFAGETSRKLLK